MIIQNLKTFADAKSDISNLIIKTIYYTVHKKSTQKMKTEKKIEFHTKIQTYKSNAMESYYISLFSLIELRDYSISKTE